MNKTLIGSLAAISLASTGVFAFTGAAEAATLGTLNISGTAVFQNGAQAFPTTDTIIFSNALVQGATTDGIFDTYDGKTATIANINLTQVSGNNYSGTTVNPFISIAPDLTFIADNPLSVIRNFTTVGPLSLLSAVTDRGITGKFVNSLGEKLGAGMITANSFNNNGSFSMTLVAEDVESVPEPATLLGLGVVGAALATSRRQKAVKS